MAVCRCVVTTATETENCNLNYTSCGLRTPIPQRSCSCFSYKKAEGSVLLSCCCLLSRATKLNDSQLPTTYLRDSQSRHGLRVMSDSSATEAYSDSRSQRVNNTGTRSQQPPSHLSFKVRARDKSQAATSAAGKARWPTVSLRTF